MYIDRLYWVQCLFTESAGGLENNLRFLNIFCISSFKKKMPTIRSAFGVNSIRNLRENTRVFRAVHRDANPQARLTKDQGNNF